MKTQKNIFQLEKENEILKQKLIRIELSSIFNENSGIVDFLNNEFYLKKVAELVEQYEIDSYLIYFDLIEKIQNQFDTKEFADEIKTLVSSYIDPIFPIFKFNKDYFVFSFSSSVSEIKARINIFLYQFNQSIFSSVLDLNVIIFSIKNCLTKINQGIDLIDHFKLEIIKAIEEKNKLEYNKIYFANIKDNIISPEIFLVEPDAFNAAIVIDILKNHNINCVWFRDGKEAYERAKNSSPICIFSEVAVPGLSGFDIKQKLIEDGISTPVVIISSQKNDDLLKLASLLGINYYLQKPYFITELISIIKIYISASI